MIAKEFSLAWQREIDVSASIPKVLCIGWTRTDLPSLSEEIANRLRIVLTLTHKCTAFCYSVKMCELPNCPKNGGRPSQCQPGETSLHNSVNFTLWSVPEHIFAPCEAQYMGRGVSGGVIFGEMCNRCQGTGNSAGETVSPCASIPLFLQKTTVGRSRPHVRLLVHCTRHALHRVHRARCCAQSWWWSEVDLLNISPHLEHLTVCINPFFLLIPVQCPSITWESPGPEPICRKFDQGSEGQKHKTRRSVLKSWNGKGSLIFV